MRKRLRVGLLGTGVAAEKLYRPAFAALSKRLTLVACASRTRTTAAAFAKRAGFSRVEDTAEALLSASDIDAIIISLPIDAQPQFVLRGLQAGKAVLSEKPIAGSEAQAKQLIKQAERYKHPWLVGENFAFMSHVRELEQRVQKGYFGEVRLVEVRQVSLMDERNPYYHTSWRQAPQHVGGFVVDGGVHLARVVVRCFGMPKVMAHEQALFNPTLRPLDTALGLLRFDSGALGTWTSCFSARDHAPMVRVLGSRSNAELYWDRLELINAAGKKRIINLKQNSFERQFAHFADVVLRGAENEATPEAALLDLQLVCRLCGGR